MGKPLYAMIMAGGKGERFWPQSTSRRPKQVLELFGGESLLARAVGYLEGLIPPERVFVITAADLAAVIRRAAPALPPDNVIGEPCGRDTAAACALGAALIRARNREATICVLTADHLIGDLDRFRATLAEGAAVAETHQALVTIGIQPVRPSTGFGYIEAGAPVAHKGQIEFRHVRRFVEKPDRTRAEEYVRAGHYYWNAGLFIWTAHAFVEALAAHRPQLLPLVERAGRASGPELAGVLAEEYAKLERISVDYAVMEKATNIIMARGVFRWDDVGSRSALANQFQADAAGNVTIGDCEAIDAAGNIVVSQDRLTALIGVRDLVVVQAEGVTLICPRDREQDVKKMVQRLRADARRAPLL